MLGSDPALWPAGERRERGFIAHDKGNYHSYTEGEGTLGEVAGGGCGAWSFKTNDFIDVEFHASFHEFGSNRTSGFGDTSPGHIPYTVRLSSSHVVAAFRCESVHVGNQVATTFWSHNRIINELGYQ